MMAPWKFEIEHILIAVDLLGFIYIYTCIHDQCADVVPGTRYSKIVYVLGVSRINMHVIRGIYVQDKVPGTRYPRAYRPLAEYQYQGTWQYTDSKWHVPSLMMDVPVSKHK